VNTASELVPPTAAPAARPAAAGPAPAQRQRNARGQGARLTEDIVTGALALIERSGSDEAVTLRAVAREVGISAPSIYAHFADREAIVMAVVMRVFGELAGAIEQGTASAGPDPAQQAAGLFDLGAFVGSEFGQPVAHAVGDRGEGVDLRGEVFCHVVGGADRAGGFQVGAEAGDVLLQGW